MARTRTVYLGQYTDEHAEEITERLETAGIDWHHKRSGTLMRWLSAADWGTRLFVEADREDEARAIADGIST